MINASWNLGNWGEKIRKLYEVGGERGEAIIGSRGERSPPLIVVTSLYLLLQFFGIFDWIFFLEYMSPVSSKTVTGERSGQGGLPSTPPPPAYCSSRGSGPWNMICRLAGLIGTQGQADWTRPKYERTIRTVMGGGTWMFFFCCCFVLFCFVFFFLR